MNILKTLAASGAVVALAASAAIAQPFFSQAGIDNDAPQKMQPEFVYPPVSDLPLDTGVRRSDLRDDVLKAQAARDLPLMRDYELPVRDAQPNMQLTFQEVRRDAIMAGIDPRFDNIYYFN